MNDHNESIMANLPTEEEYELAQKEPATFRSKYLGNPMITKIAMFNREEIDEVDGLTDKQHAHLCQLCVPRATEDRINELIESRTKEILNTKRNKNAGFDMVEAHFHDWLVKRGWSNSEAFKFSGEIGSKLIELQSEGFLVVLQGESRCYHCGVKWPKDWSAEFGKEPDITWCSKCQDKREEFLPKEEVWRRR